MNRYSLIITLLVGLDSAASSLIFHIFGGWAMSYTDRRHTANLLECPDHEGTTRSHIRDGFKHADFILTSQRLFHTVI